MGRTSIIVGVVSLLLLGFIVFFERGSLSTSEREGRKGRILEAFVRDRVSRIEIQRKGVTTVLVRDEDTSDDTANVLDATGSGAFRVTQPYAAAADRDAVDSLLGSLEWIAPRRSLGDASEQDLASFGLDKPRYRVSFVIGRERLRFSIGASTGDGTGAYLLTAHDKRAYVVGNDLVESLDHDPVDFHTKELHRGVSAFTAEKLSLRDASGEHVIQKRGELFWLVRPEPVLASEPALGDVVHALDALKASRFVVEKPGNLADYGLDTPRLSVALDSKVFDAEKKAKSQPEHLELRVGKACASHAAESYVRVDRGPVMCASDAELAKLSKPAAALREARLLVLDDGDIRSIELRSGKRELRVEEKDAGHRYRVLDGGREIQSGEVDAAAFSDWLKSLRGALAHTFEDSAAASAGAPTTLLKFERGKDKPAYEVQLGRVQGERVAVSRGGEKAVAWFGSDVQALLSISAVRFRKLRLLDEDAGKFTRLTVSGTGRPNEVVSKRGDRYVLEEPGVVKGIEAERSSVDELVRLAAKLEAVRFVADAPLAEHGLGQPSFVIALEWAGAHDKPGKRHSVRLGAATEDGRYAQLDSDPAVFVVAPTLVRQVASPLVSRGSLAVPLEQLGAFEVTSSAGSVRVEPDAGGFTAVTGAGRDVKLGAALARAVATLRVSRATGYGKASPAEGMDQPEARVTIRLRGAATGERTVTIGRPVGSDPTADVYARRSDLDVGFTLPRSALDALRPPSAAANVTP